MRVDELKVFENTDLGFGKIRNVNEGSKEYFFANDIAKALGYSNYTKAISTHCIHCITKEVEVPQQGGGVQVVKARFISEGDIYRLIIKSKLPTAQEFERWVFDEVLPSIRANGMYVSTELSDDQLERAKVYFDERLLKRLLKTCNDEEIINEYTKARKLQSNKVEYDEKVIKILKKRPLGANTNKLLLKLVDKQTKRAIKMANKYKTRLQAIEPLDEDYTEINAHGFSINYQYETLEGDKKKKSNAYRTWWDNFPHNELPSIEGIDFNKGVDVWLRFINFRAKKHDATNFHKSIIDKLCDCYQVDDININIRECRSIGECSSYEDGKIYICVRQALDK